MAPDNADIAPHAPPATPAGMDLPVALGRGPDDALYFGDLTRMLHLLVAGGSAADVARCLCSIVADLVTRHSPTDVRIVVGSIATPALRCFSGVPHQDTPPVTCADDGRDVLAWALGMLEWRHRLLAAAGARDLGQYNRIAAGAPVAGGPTLAEGLPSRLPRLVIVLDELHAFHEDGMLGVGDAIGLLGQMARAVDIHLILATSHPTPDVLTAYIKAHMPVRLAMRVDSTAESRTILDCHGAEALGDDEMLLLPRNWHRLVPLRARASAEEPGLTSPGASATSPRAQVDC